METRLHFHRSTFTLVLVAAASLSSLAPHARGEDRAAPSPKSAAQAGVVESSAAAARVPALPLSPPALLVPYESLPGAFASGDARVLIPLSEYQTNRNQPAVEPAGPAYVLDSIDYKGRVVDSRFELTAVVRATVRRRNGAVVPLFSAHEVALTAARMAGESGTQAPLVIEDNDYAVVLQEPGFHEIVLTGFVRSTFADDVYSAPLIIPRAGLSRFELFFAGDGVLPLLDSLCYPVADHGAAGTTVTGLLSGRDAWLVQWKTRGADVPAVIAATAAETLSVDNDAFLLARFNAALTTSARFPPDMKILLPRGWEFRSAHGVKLDGWRVEPTSGTLAVVLQIPPGSDQARMEIVVRKPLDLAAASETVPVFEIPGVQRLEGFLFIEEPDFMKVHIKKTESIEPVPLARYPAEFAPAGRGQTFRYDATPFSAAFSLERIAPAFWAELATRVTVGDTLAETATQIRVVLTQSALGSVDLLVPRAATVSSVTGEPVRRWVELPDDVPGAAPDAARRLRVEFGKLVRKEAVFQVNLETPYAEAGLDAPEIRVVDAERERGFIGVVAAANVEIHPRDPRNLISIDPTELAPFITGEALRPSLAAFRYLGHPWSVHLDVTKHADVAVVATVIDAAAAFVAVSENGRLLTDLHLKVKNTVGQRLALDLPEDAELWSCTVAGIPVKAARDDKGRLLLPLIRLTDARKDSAFPIRVVYLLHSSKDALSAPAIPMPRFDVPVNAFVVTLQSAPGWTLDKIDGPFSIRDEEDANRLLGGSTSADLTQNIAASQPALSSSQSQACVDWFGEKLVGFRATDLTEEEIAKIDGALSTYMLENNATKASVDDLVGKRDGYISRELADRAKGEAPRGGPVGVLPLKIDLPPAGRRYVGLTTLLVPRADGLTDSMLFNATLQAAKSYSASRDKIVPVLTARAAVIALIALVGVLLAIRWRQRRRRQA